MKTKTEKLLLELIDIVDNKVNLLHKRLELLENRDLKKKVKK